jgi:HemY protein
MFTVFWFITALFLITYSVAWLVDNNGSVVVNWLGYEMQTDVLTIIIFTIILTILIIFLASFFTRILAIKFPSLLKFFFKRNYTKSLEKIVARHHQGFDELSQLLLAIECRDEKYINLHLKNFAKKIKNKKLNDFLKGKIALDKKDYSTIVKYFSQFIGNNHANIIALNGKFNMALNQKDETRVIAYGKQLIKLENNPEIAKKLIPYCKKNGLWKDVKELLKIAGYELNDQLSGDEVKILNLFEAKYFYQQKKFCKAMKFAKILLKKEPESIPALSIYLKSQIKIGFRFIVAYQIKKLWQKKSQIFLSEIYDLNYRKFSPNRRFNLMKKLVKKSSNKNLANFALAHLAFKIGNYQQAIEILKELVKLDPNIRSYQILANSFKMLGNNEDHQKYLTLAKNYIKS